MTTEWPKSWSDIRDDNGESGLSRFKTTWVDYSGGIRGYNGTLYASITLGKEVEENKDEWMPMDVYIENKVKEVIKNERSNN